MRAGSVPTGVAGRMDEPGEVPPTAGNGPMRSHGQGPELAWALRSDAGEVRTHNEDFAGATVPVVVAPAPDSDSDPGRDNDQAGALDQAPAHDRAPHHDQVRAPEMHDAGPGSALRGPLFVVCDGLGGHSSGEVASRTAVEAAMASWRTGRHGAAHQAVRAAARAANLAVYDASLTPGHRGMGTTFTALTLAGREAVISHVGDSRAYLVRNGVCSQLTADHSRVGEMLRMGLISAEQAAVHPGRSQLTRTVGTDLTVQVDVVRTATEPDDVLVLCSDGLWDVVARHEVADIVGPSAVQPPDGSEPEAEAIALIADRLVDRALARRTPDNVTVLVVRVAHAQLPDGDRRRAGRLRWGRR